MDLREATYRYLSVRQQLGEENLLLPREVRQALDRITPPQPSSRPVSRVSQVSKEKVAEAGPIRQSAPIRPAAKTPEPVEAPPVPVVRESVAPRASRLTLEEKIRELDHLRSIALSCQKCAHLAASRTQVVFGVGNPAADIMFVGEAPGADEDLEGEPFVGAAGKLLTKMIEAMGLRRSDVYIGNVLKCRPDMPAGSTGNRKPTPGEMSTCLPYLASQIDIIQPQVLVCLGATAVEGLMSVSKVTMGSIRGKWQDFRGIPAMATYHPAYLLRNQSMAEKRKVWEDLLKVMEKVGLPISEKQRNYFLKSG